MLMNRNNKATPNSLGAQPPLTRLESTGSNCDHNDSFNEFGGLTSANIFGMVASAPGLMRSEEVSKLTQG